jgi:hypothetical protein
MMEDSDWRYMYWNGHVQNGNVKIRSMEELVRRLTGARLGHSIMVLLEYRSPVLSSWVTVPARYVTL